MQLGYARHPHVKHPRELDPARETFGERLNGWVTDHLAMALGSVAGMYLALVIPLLAFEIPALLKVVGLVSSYWIQLWALFCLQRSANRAEARRAAKADTDHEALTHIANVIDRIEAKVNGAG